MNDSSICLCGGNETIFIKNSAIKDQAIYKNRKCIYGGDEIIFVVKKDTIRSQVISKPGEVDPVDVNSNISSETVNDVQTVSENCIHSEKNISHPLNQESLPQNSNLSKKKIKSIVDSEIKDDSNKKTSSISSKSTKNNHCCISLSLATLGLIIGVALAILGGVTWTPVCLGIGIALGALSACVLIRDIVNGCCPTAKNYNFWLSAV